MPRNARFVLTDVVHHVVARGVDRKRIFYSDEEKSRYLARFSTVAEEEKVLVHGYCLMNNHVHFILTPTTPNGMARLFQRVHTWWALWFNRAHKRTGHLFQNRYYSSALSESHYWRALRYVELNPKRAGMVKEPQQFRFSSAWAHCTSPDNSPIPLKPVETRSKFTPELWKAYLSGEDDPAVTLALRRALPGSRPVGEPEWLAQHSRQANRQLAWRPVGRPKKQEAIQVASR